MEGLDEILVPMVIAGIVFYGVFAEMRNQAKSLVAENSKRKPETAVPVEKKAVVIEKEPKRQKKTETTHVKAKPKAFLNGDVTEPSLKVTKDTVYDKEDEAETAVDDAMSDLRRAVIAHEILKRKY